MKIIMKVTAVLILFYFLFIIGLYVHAVTQPETNADVGIIYGNKVELTGEPSQRLKARLAAGVTLYQQQRVNRLVVSGGIGKEGYDEAQVMADYLVKSGVNPHDIVIDSQGYNTHLTSMNAVEALGKETSVIAVSQHYHLSRSMLSLHHSGFETVSGYGAEYHEWRDIYAYVREVPAWLKYKIRSL